MLTVAFYFGVLVLTLADTLIASDGTVNIG